MSVKSSGLRSGVYVDVENIERTGGRGMRFNTLREYACRDGASALRLNAYLAFNEEDARRDQEYRKRTAAFHSAVRGAGFTIIEKPVRWFTNDVGVRLSKADSDLDLAVDMLLQSTRLDRVVLVSGDGDFVKVVRAVKNTGCRVELLAFANVSYNLRCECDLFTSGYLIPRLLPAPENTPPWGEPGSRVRGTCVYYDSEKSYGFLRYLVKLDNLTVTDPRESDSPYEEVRFYRKECPKDLNFDLLPTHDSMVFEWTLKAGSEEKQNLTAKDIEVIYDYAPAERKL